MCSVGTFGADIGAIWRSGLDTESKAVLTSVRYHGDASGVAQVSVTRIAEVASVHRATAIRRLAELVVQGWIERSGEAGGPSVYRVTPVAPSDGSPATLSQRATGGGVAACDGGGSLPATRGCRSQLPGGVAACDGSPTPPNKEFQILSGFSPAAAAPAAAPAHAHEAPAPPSGETGAPVHLDHLGEFVELWLRTQATRQGGLGPGLTGSTAMRDTIAELLRTHDLDRVRWAIRRAVEATNNGAPSLGFLRKLCAEGPKTDAPRQGRTPASPYRNPDQSAPCGPRPVDPSKGEIDF